MLWGKVRDWEGSCQRGSEGIRSEEVNPEEVVAGNCVLGFNFIMPCGG